jgi:hypothetical protein
MWHRHYSLRWDACRRMIWVLRLYILSPLFLGLVGSASAQVVERLPVQVIVDELAFQGQALGRVVALDGESLLVANPYGGRLADGYISFWRHSIFGYSYFDRVWPEACFTGPYGSPLPGVGTSSCLFPFSLQVEGGVAVAGSLGGDFVGQSPNLGLVHVLRQRAFGWEAEQYIRGFADPLNSPIGFGRLVRFDGTTIAMSTIAYRVPGSLLEGAVQVYERDVHGIFERVATLRPPTHTGGPPPMSSWAFAIGMDVDHGVMVASEWHQAAERVRVFERGPTGWSLVQTIERAPFAGVAFGRVLALDSRAGVLAIGEESGHGAVWVYERDVTTQLWQPTAFLTPMEGSSFVYGAQFGWDLRVRGDTIVVGAPYGALEGRSTGAVDVFRRGPPGLGQGAAGRATPRTEHACGSRPAGLRMVLGSGG